LAEHDCADPEDFKDAQMSEIDDERLIEAGRLLFARPWGFVRGITAVDQLPAPEAVEIAFAGRSNVGKSSLINALTGRSGLARTSNTPGRTQELNLFTPEGEDRLLLVDMPGYGFAEAPKAKVDLWNQLIRDYLRGRVNLRRVYVLIDARHGLKKNDLEVLDILDRSAVSYQIVLTKADKIKATALAHLVEATHTAVKKRPASYPVVLATSSEKGLGLPELKAAVAQLLEE
jgi:GTP-binding protein